MSQGGVGGQEGAGVKWALDETLTSLHSLCFHHHHQSFWNLRVGGTFEDHGRRPGFECGGVGAASADGALMPCRCQQDPPSVMSLAQ